MSQERPTPEQMLARVHHEEGSSHRGRLRIFFGYAAGVGKTYAMLKAARELQADGTEVVAGYVEPHNRPETTALLNGLELLPTLAVTYRGATVQEFDLAAALRRHPKILLVDELAHTNADGMQHPKRWQDVHELLDAGIDVYTTLNVQHVESLNDVVAQITGVSVRETIPDDVFYQADQVELIDLTPEELVERLQEGKVYIPAQAQRAMQSFFRKQNLVALRELALRRTADRVHADVQAARFGLAAGKTWPTAERLLVCVGPSPTSAKVIRATKRLADSLRADWLAVHIQTPAETPEATNRLSETQARLAQNLHLAEELGAEIITTAGEDVASSLVRCALAQNVSKIVIGKSDHQRKFRAFRPTVVDRLLQQSGDIDVYVIRGLGDRSQHPTSRLTGSYVNHALHLPQVALVLSVATLLAAVCYQFGLTEANVVMLYLLGVFLVAFHYGRLPGILSSILSVMLFDILFIPPRFSFAIGDSQYLITFTVMLTIALLTSTLTARVRRQAELALINQERTEALYRVSCALTSAAVLPAMLAEAERAARDVFGGEAAAFVPDAQRMVHVIVDHPADFAANASEVAVAQWVLDHGRPAGRATDTLPSVQALYLPIRLGERVIGVLGLKHPHPEILLLPDPKQLLEAFCRQLAQALDRSRLIDATLQAEVDTEKERLRSSLLSSVSHDLRTPLAVIAGASSSLLDFEHEPPQAIRRELLETIHEEAQRLTRLVENLLNMTRLESGAVTVQKEWHVLEEVVGSALSHLKFQLVGRQVLTKLPSETTLIPLDPILIEQVLVNLVENAVKYSPAGRSIEISATTEPGQVRIEVLDHGKGFAPGEEDQVFEKFYRGALANRADRGAGLGLAICRAIVKSHGGKIWAANHPDGGARVTFTLPIEGLSPTLPVEAEEENEAEDAKQTGNG
jgi:two-component system sensor histidine kinase KdpD